MYQKEEVERLAGEYVETGNEQVFEILIKALEPLINVQLGKNYSRYKEFWDDLRQEVLLKLHKNRGGLSTTKSESLYQFLYSRIRTELNRLTELKKHENQWKSEEEKVNESSILKLSNVESKHGNCLVIEFDENGKEKQQHIEKAKPDKRKKGDIDYLPESLELINRQLKDAFQKRMKAEEDMDDYPHRSEPGDFSEK